jgi:putative ABC transport system permease protein
MRQLPYWFTLALRLFHHEVKRGELTIVFLAIVLSVTTVFTLTGFTDAIKQALTEQSSRFIAADNVLASPRPIAFDWQQQAKQFELKTAEQVLMTTMVFAQDQLLLAQLKAVSSEYPLRGELLSSDNESAQPIKAHAPPSGEVWVEKALLTKLQIKVGDLLEIGQVQFKVSGVIAQIPDASFSVFTAGPTVILNLTDMAKTGLIQPASRVTFQYLFAGNTEALTAFGQWLKPQLNDTQNWYNVKSRQSPLAQAINRAEKYLKVASMLGIVLASIAIAVGARRYSQRHESTVAVLKAMGAAKSFIWRIYATHWLLLSTIAIITGLVLGWGLVVAGLTSMKAYIMPSTSPDYSAALVTAAATGFITSIAFASAPLLALIAKPALAVIRALPEQANQQWLHTLFSLSSVVLLLWWFSDSLQLTLIILLGCSVVIACILLIAWGLLLLTRQIGTGASSGFKLAVANVKRRAKSNAVQLISFTLAIQLLLVLVVLQQQLIDEWQQQLPDDAPNRYLVNIAQTEVDTIKRELNQAGVATSMLYPIVRARLQSINGESLQQQASKEDVSANDRGRVGIGRELNITTTTQLSIDNTVVAGKFWQQDKVSDEVSIEQRIAQRLGIQLNDVLTFMLGSQQFSVTVTSIRQVNWSSMKPNFYMIVSPDVLAKYPINYIAALHVNPEQVIALQQVLTEHPTVSMIDVDALIAQLRQVIDQVSLAIQFILMIVVLASVLVLIAQVQASMEERERELAILRTLGAKGKLLRQSVWFEFIVQGAVAGFIASGTMEIISYWLQTHLFNLSWHFHGQYWLVAIVSGALFVGSVGALACQRLLTLSSATLIRRTL